MRDAARIAHSLADQAGGRGALACAALYKRIAVETDHRADRLSLLWRRSSPGADGLSAWIDALRARLGRGDLAALAPIDFGDGTRPLSAKHTVEILLADLDSFNDMTLNDARNPATVVRYYALLDDFRRLRFLIR